MAFGFTGYLLPWDQRAYWATVVGVEIMDKTPIVGDFMARFLKGGPTPGQMTLSRFFVIHVMVLPGALMGLAGLHIFLFRKAGPAGPFRGTPEELKAKTDYFFPRQIWKDIVAMASVFLIICSLAFIEPVVLLGASHAGSRRLSPRTRMVFSIPFSTAASQDVWGGVRSVYGRHGDSWSLYGLSCGPSLYR